MPTVNLSRSFKIRIEGKLAVPIEVTDTSDVGIMSGTMSLEEILCESELTFGSVCSNKFEVSLFNLSKDVSGNNITVTMIEDGTEKPVFKGIIDSSTTDYVNNDRAIVAYDQLYSLRSSNIAAWWNELWGEGTTTTTETITQDDDGNDVTTTTETTVYPTYTMTYIRQSLVEYLGLSSTSVGSFDTDSIQVTKWGDFTKLTATNAFQMLGEIGCFFTSVSRDGVVEFIQLGTTAVDLTGNYERAATSFEDYTTDKITGVCMYDTSNNLLNSAGDVSNPYNISGNVFLLSLSDADRKTALTRILNAVSEIQYTPCDIKCIVGGLDLHLGDYIKCSALDPDTNTDKYYYSYVMSNTLSGVYLVEQEITGIANGQTRETDASSSNNQLIDTANNATLTAAVAKVTAAVGEFSTVTADVANIKTILSGSIGTGSLQTIRITADNAVIDSGVLVNAIAKELTAGEALIGDLTAGTIQLTSGSGDEIITLTIDSQGLQIKDADGNVRLQSGMDGEGNYNYNIYDADGNLLWNALGLGSSTVRDVNVAEGAAIKGSKLDIDSVINSINDDGTETMKASRITVNDTTLDVALTEINTKLDESVTEQTVLTVVQGEINTQVSEHKIIGEEYLEDNYSTTDQTKELIKSEVGAMTYEVNGNEVTLQTAISTLEQTTSDINLVVSETAQKQANMKVGATNLIRNSHSMLFSDSVTGITYGFSSETFTYVDESGNILTDENGNVFVI